MIYKLYNLNYEDVIIIDSEFQKQMNKENILAKWNKMIILKITFLDILCENQRQVSIFLTKKFY